MRARVGSHEGPTLDGLRTPRSLMNHSDVTRTRAPRRHADANHRHEPGARPERDLDSTVRFLIALESLVSLCGLAGGAYMASHSLTMMPLRYLDGTWFHTWRWPGVALFVFVGVGPALAVVATVARHRFEMVGHFGVGVGLVAWIVLEAAWMVVSPVMQITFGVIGMAIIVLASSEHQRRKAGPRV